MIYNIQQQQGICYPQSIEKTWLVKLVYSCNYRGFKTSHWFRGKSNDTFYVSLSNKYYPHTKLVDKG